MSENATVSIWDAIQNQKLCQKIAKKDRRVQSLGFNGLGFPGDGF
jgi:hypothetical protein